MRLPRFPIVDSTVVLLSEGYAWLPDLFRKATGPVVHTRLIGRPTTGLHGPDAVRFFYDEDHIVRNPALPEPVLSTLFGHGAVHTLDGDMFRVRKELFVSQLMRPEAVRGMVEQIGAAWDEAIPAWA
ncbi:cytochrome P450, partial [Actinomadura adrarensis]